MKMLECGLMKDGKCQCVHKCPKLIWYEIGYKDGVKAEQKKEEKEDEQTYDRGTVSDAVTIP